MNGRKGIASTGAAKREEHQCSKGTSSAVWLEGVAGERGAGGVLGPAWKDPGGLLRGLEMSWG